MLSTSAGLYYTNYVGPTYVNIVKITGYGALSGLTDILADAPADKSILTHSVSGIFYSDANATTWNRSNMTSGNFSYVSKDPLTNTYYAGSNAGVYKSTDAATWTLVDMKTPVFTQVATSKERDREMFSKYSANANINPYCFANIKNIIHSSYQMHPFIVAFKQYIKASKGIQNLFNYVIPEVLQSYNNIQSHVDNYGNSVNFWLDDNADFSGYRSQYEQSNEKVYNPLLSKDSPFNFDALDSYINNFANFTSTETSAASSYYSVLNLTDYEKSKIAYQLNACYNNIKDLENYRIYKYGKDALGNVYILYKSRNEDNERGQLWLRLKNHPIAFPAFILDSNTNLLSEYGQITDTTMNTLNGVLASSYDVTYAGPLTGTMQFSNVSLSSASISTTAKDNTFLSELTTPVSIMFSDNNRSSFYTTNISANPQLSGIFPNDLSGNIIFNSASLTGFTPTISASYDINTPRNVIFNSGNIILSNGYGDTTLSVIGVNAFSASNDIRY
jgi:hypothetical protein